MLCRNAGAPKSLTLRRSPWPNPSPSALSSAGWLSLSSYGRQWTIYNRSLAERMVLDAEILPVFGHNGSGGTMSFVDPLRDVIVCYFTQSRDTSTLTPMMVLAGEAIK